MSKLEQFTVKVYSDSLNENHELDFKIYEVFAHYDKEARVIAYVLDREIKQVTWNEDDYKLAITYTQATLTCNVRKNNGQ